ncbi:hypothetical protein HRI_001212400 [Hibiscus trionum]|uniref:Uncharacterized protein n=1 Tax=Hibiscus trionum TaxID=183268 RepID=A0A9W7HDY2_HIBTR|nr:hypothetical protein HRI_001212400 [Hibiscus trionum]
MLKDLVSKFFPCQEFAFFPRQQIEPLKSITSPWPFAVWGIDILGPFPLVVGQKNFLVVAVNYFTKWNEADPLSTITEKQMENFL